MSLLVWLPLNKEGDFLNKGLSNVTITNNGATYDANGKIGGCYSGNPADTQYMTIGKMSVADFMTNYINNHSFSLCAWIKTTVSTPIIGLTYGLHLTSAGISLYNSSRTVRASDSTALDGNWHHICGTYDVTSGKISFYVDGINKSSANYPSGYTYSSSWNNFLGIGRNSNTSTANNNYFLQGSINDVRIYDHCLSPKEVKEISKGLVVHYPLTQYNWLPATTNLIPNSDTLLGWSNYGSGYTSIEQCELGDNKLVITNKQSWCGIYKNISIPSAGTYTWSVYCKPISRSKTSINQTLYINGNGYNDVSVSVSWDNPGEWKRLSMTKTYALAGTVTLYLICYGGSQTSDYTISAEYWHPQLELSTEPSEYIKDSRDSIVFDNSGYENNGVIVNNLTTSTDSPRYKTSTNFNGTAYITHNKCLDSSNQEWTVNCWIKPSEIVNYAYVNNFNLSNRIWHGTYPLLYINSGSNDYYRYGNRAVTTDEWQMITFVFKDSSLRRDVYINGIKTNGSGPGRDECIPSGIPNSILLFRTFKGLVSDYREYATALSDEDILELYNTSAIIDNQKTEYCYEFIETNNSKELCPSFIELILNARTKPPANTIYDNLKIEFKLTGSIYSKFIEIDPTKTYYYDITYSCAAGNLFYIGFERWDANKTNTSNSSCFYKINTKPSTHLNNIRTSGTFTIQTDSTGSIAKYTCIRILNAWTNTTSDSEKWATIHNFSLIELDSGGDTKISKNSTVESGMFREDYNLDVSISKYGYDSANQLIEM